MSYRITVYNDPETAQSKNDGVSNIRVYTLQSGNIDVQYGEDYSATGFTSQAKFTASFDDGYAFYRWVYNTGDGAKYSDSNPFTFTGLIDIQIRCESQESQAETYYGEVDYYVDGEYYDYDYDYDDSEDEGAYLYFEAINAPSKEGYNFLGWATSYGAITPQYRPGDSIQLYATSQSSSYPTTLKLYSVYEQKQQTYYARLVYDADVGANPPSPYTISQQATSPPTITITISSQEPTPPTGYEFLNWRCTEDGQTYYGGSTISFTATSQDQSNPTTRHLVAQYTDLGSLYLYTNISSSSRRFLLGIPYTYNGSTFEPYLAYLDHETVFVQGAP